MIDAQALKDARARVAANDGTATDDDRRIVELHGAQDERDEARADGGETTKSPARKATKSASTPGSGE